MAWAELLEQEWEEHFGHFAKDLEQMDSSGAPWGRVFFGRDSLGNSYRSQMVGLEKWVPQMILSSFHHHLP